MMAVKTHTVVMAITLVAAGQTELVGHKLWLVTGNSQRNHLRNKSAEKLKALHFAFVPKLD